MRISDWSSDVCSSDLPYRRMRVWDAAGGGELKFDADAFGRRELGWIVENGLLVDRLWAALPAAGVRVHCPARVVALEAGGDREDDFARLRLDDGSQLQARIAIAADGPPSTLSELAALAVERPDYSQRGGVGYVSNATNP